MARFGFVGPTYQSQSVNVDAQRCINFYPEIVESGDGVTVAALYSSPGLSQFAQKSGAQQVRGIYTASGSERTFSVIDSQLYEVFSNGTLTSRGAVTNDNGLVSWASSTQQVLVASGGSAYCLTLATNAFQQVGVGIFSGPVSQVGYIDGFFLALVAPLAQFFVSNPLDATTWQGLQTKILSTISGGVVSMICDHREAWFFGQRQTDVEYDSGNIFPFDTVPGGFMEQGAGAQFATVQMDNSVFCLGQRDDQGLAVAWRMNGYSPQRVSTHAIEFAWQAYPQIADARAYSYQENGHTFWHINFPSANASWRYDAATQQWSEPLFWNGTQFVMHRSQCHTFNFGKHLVGDPLSGTIYQMSSSILNDFGNPRRRLRRAPHVSTEQQWIYHHELQIHLESGLGPQIPLRDGNGNPRGPMLTLRYSDDYGHSWSNPRDVDCGQAGDFKTRVMFRRLGRSRGRVYEISATDPVPYRIVDAYLRASPGFQTQERLPKQLGKIA